MTYLAVPEDTQFLTPDDANAMVRLLRHVISECEARTVEDYSIPLDLATVRDLLDRLDR